MLSEKDLREGLASGKIVPDKLGNNGPFTPDDQLRAEAKPIAIELNPQELGAFWAKHGANPFEFQQYLLAIFKAAGVPVEGQLFLKLAHGHIYKVGEEMAGHGKFKYVWMPEVYDAAIQAWQRPRLELEGREVTA